MNLPAFRIGIVLGVVGLTLGGCASIFKSGVQSVTIDSTPSGATVMVDEQPVGTTPLTLDLARCAPHRVVVEKTGFARGSAVIVSQLSSLGRCRMAWGGGDETSGEIHELTPAPLTVALRPSNLPWIKQGDAFDALSTKVLEADGLLKAGAITPEDHRYMVAEIVKFYSTP